SRSELSSLTRSNYGAVRQRQPVYRPRILLSLFLSPLVLVLLLRGHSRNRSAKFARRDKKDGIVRGVGQHRQHRLGQSEDAGRVLETTGSTSDLKSHSTVGLPNREIDAIACWRESDLQ